jgi:hypothetical protein
MKSLGFGDRQHSQREGQRRSRSCTTCRSRWACCTVSLRRTRFSNWCRRDRVDSHRRDHGRGTDTVVLTLGVVVTRLGMVTYGPSIALGQGERLMGSLVRVRVCVLVRLLYVCTLGPGEGPVIASQPIQHVRCVQMRVLRCSGSRSALDGILSWSDLFAICACL